MSEEMARGQKWWNVWGRAVISFLFEPQAALKEVGNRRQAQAVSALTFFMFIGSTLGIGGSFSSSGQMDSDVILLSIISLLAFIAYWLGRTRYYQYGMALLLGGVVFVTFLGPVFAPQNIYSFVETLLPFIFLLPLGIYSSAWMVGLTGLNMLLVLLMPVYLPSIEQFEYGTLIGQVFSIGLLAIAVAGIRTAVEKARLKESERANEELQRLRVALEQRVEERTRDIALAAEVGRRVSQQRDPNALLPQAVELINQRFNLYYTQIYLMDTQGRGLVLRAGSGEVGAALLRAGHRLALDLTSLNGTAALERRPILVENTITTSSFRPHPLLPYTRSEMTVPLISGDRVLGVLDLQSRNVGSFNEENLPVFETLAGLLASALENARLIAQAQNALMELEEHSRHSIRQGWQEYLDGIETKERIAYSYQDNTFQSLETSLEPSNDPQVLTVPLKVSGEPVGTFQLSTERNWTPEEAELVQMVAAQVAQQVENMRLLGQAERYRAEAEEAVRRLTGQEWQEYIKEGSEGAFSFIYARDQVEELAPSAASQDPMTQFDILVNEETIGYLGITAHGNISEEDADLVSIVSEQLASHLENMRLYATAQRELEERRRTQNQLQESQERIETSRRTLQAVLDNMPAGVFMVEVPSGKPILSNKKAEEFLGRGISPDAKEDDLNQVYQAYKFGTEELYQPQDMPVVAGMYGISKTIDDMEVRKPDGSRVLLEVSGSPVYDASGNIAASVVVFADVTDRRHTQQFIETQRRTLQAVLDNMAAGVFMVEVPSGKPILSNKKAEEFLGRGISPDASEDDLNQVYQAYKFGTEELYPPQDMPVVAGMYGISKTIDDMEVRKPDGSRVLLEVSGSPVYDASGNIAASVVVFTDVTDRRRTQQFIETQRRTLQAVLDNMAAGVFMIEVPTGRPILSNKKAEEFLGRGISPDASESDLNQVYQAYKFGTEELYPPQDMPVVAGMYGKTAHIDDMEVRKPDGSRVLLDVTGSPVYDLDGNVVASVVVFQNISEAHRTQAIISRERALLRGLIDSVPDLIFYKDLDGVYLGCNIAFEEFAGVKESALVGKTDFDLFDKEVAAFFRQQDQEMIANRITRNNEEWVSYPDGRQVLLDTLKTPFFGPDGSVLGLIGISRNITERRRQDEIIATRAAQLATVSEVATVIANILNPDEMLQTVVDMAKGSFNLYHAHVYLLNETNDALVLTKGAGDVGRQMVSEGRKILVDAEKSLVARAARTREGVIVNDVRLDPEFLPHPLLPETRSEMAVPMMVGDRLLGVLDVQSDRVGRFTEEDVLVKTTLASQVAVALQNARQYAETRASEELTRTVINSTPDWIFIKDRSHRFRLANRGYADSLHLDLDHIVGKDDVELGFPEELIKGNPEKGIKGFWADDDHVINANEALHIPEDLVMLDGKMHIFDTFKTPLRDAAGIPWGVLAFARDVTGLQNLLRENRTLYEGSRLLSRCKTYEDVIKTLSENTLLKNFSGSSLNLFDRPWGDTPPSQVRVAALWVREPDHVMFKAGQVLPIKTLPGIDEMAGTSHVIIGNVENAPELPEPARNFMLQGGIRATITFKMVVSGEFIGTINASSPHAVEFTEEEIRTFLNLAEQAVTVIQSLRLFEQVQRALEETANLYMANRRLIESQDLSEMLASLMEAFNIPDITRAALLLFEYDASGELDNVVARENYCLPGETPSYPNGFRFDREASEQIFSRLRANSPTFYEETNEHEQSMGVFSLIVLPLWLGTQQIGTIVLQLPRAYHFSPEEKRLGAPLAQQASVAVQNRLLLESAQSRAKREQSLREITARVRGSMDPETILRTAVRELGTAIGRQVFVRMGTAERLLEKPDGKEQEPGNGNGHQSLTGEGGN